MYRQIVTLALVATLTAGCVTAPRVNADGSTEARLGQKVDLGGPKVTLLKVLEDSRCPMEARCVWAGRVKLSVRIDLDSGTSVQELTSDKTLSVADGQLELLGTMPPTSTQRPIAPGDYHFALKFSGGL